MCNGCGLCIPNCPEGAIQLIDGKAVVVSDMFCDGLGACLGHCPEGAITIEERETEEYSESKVMENIVTKGNNTIIAHLEHLQEHGEQEYLREALEFLNRRGINVDFTRQHTAAEFTHTGCPGARMMMFEDPAPAAAAASAPPAAASAPPAAAAIHDETKAAAAAVTDIPVAAANIAWDRPSELRQWPIQLHLVPPTAPYYRNRDVVLAADCVAYSMGDFHKKYLKGKPIAIACPKLDQELDIYVEKLKIMVEQAEIRSLTVLIMEVPCCGGLYRIARTAVEQSARKIPVHKVVVSIKGEESVQI